MAGSGDSVSLKRVNGVRVVKRFDIVNCQHAANAAVASAFPGLPALAPFV